MRIQVVMNFSHKLNGRQKNQSIINYLVHKSETKKEDLGTILQNSVSIPLKRAKLTRLTWLIKRMLNSDGDTWNSYLKYPAAIITPVISLRI